MRGAGIDSSRADPHVGASVPAGVPRGRVWPSSTWTRDKYGDQANSPTVEAFHSAIKDLVRRRLDESGVDWNSFVFDKSYDLITAADFEEIERKLLDAGHRYDFSAVISVNERPEAYKPAEGILGDDPDWTMEHPDAPSGEADSAGRALCGVGDNVMRVAENTVGTARYVRSSSQVMRCLGDGVPAGDHRHHRRFRRHSDGADPGAVHRHYLHGRHGALPPRHSGAGVRHSLLHERQDHRDQGRPAAGDGDRQRRRRRRRAYQKGEEMTANIWKLV